MQIDVCDVRNVSVSINLTLYMVIKWVFHTKIFQELNLIYFDTAKNHDQTQIHQYKLYTDLSH